MTEKIYDSFLNETLYKHVHKSGLTIYNIPKTGHTKSYAAFATKYGSLINEFKVDDIVIIKNTSRAHKQADEEHVDLKTLQELEAD